MKKVISYEVDETMTERGITTEARRVRAVAERIREQDRAEAAEREARMPAVPRGRTLTERVLGSADYAQGRSRGMRATIDVQLPGVLSTRELANALRQRTTLDSTTGAGLLHEDVSARQVFVAPKPARLPSLVNVVELDELLVHRTDTGSYAGNAAPTLEGNLYPELTSLNLTDEQVQLYPFAASGEVTRGHFNDSGLFRSALEKLFYAEFWRQVETGMVAGTGVAPDFPGILTNGSVTSVAKGAGTRVAALAQAVADVQDGGFYGPLTVAACPQTLRAILADTDAGGIVRTRAALPDVAAWVPVAGLTAGSAIVGSWHEGAALFLNGGLSLQVSTEHADFFLAGKVAVKLETNAAFRVTQPAAFTVVTGL